MREDIHSLRLDIDFLAKLIVGEPINTSHNVLRSAQSLYFAKAWLGKLLGEFPDNVSPYKDGKQTVADIEPTADQYKLGQKIPSHILCPLSWSRVDYTIVQKIDILRQDIGKLADITKALTELPGTREAAICGTQVWVYLCEAWFYLGFALEDIRNKADNDQAI